MRTTIPYPLLVCLCAALCGGCASEEEKLPCPSVGIGGEGLDEQTQADQITNYRKYGCSKPQICPDRGGIAGAYAIDEANPASEAGFILTNCSTGSEKLEITKIEVYGDERCYFTDVTDKEIERKTVLPGESTAIRTTYKPLQPGEDYAELRIYSNAENYPVLRLLVCSLAFVEAPEPDGGVAPQAGDAGAGPADQGPASDSLPALQCKKVETKNSACHQ